MQVCAMKKFGDQWKFTLEAWKFEPLHFKQDPVGEFHNLHPQSMISWFSPLNGFQIFHSSFPAIKGAAFPP
jgi:hypothetical protein